MLEGKVAIVTGAGRGLGRAHALALASEGAAVVVNDYGVTLGGVPDEGNPAADVVAAIEAAGGRAFADRSDCADWDSAQRLVAKTVERFGDLDILVNNAGILRDRMSFNMSEAEFDDVVRVHLKGHFAMIRHAAAHWREQSKAGRHRRRSIINTTSEAGLHGTVGQVNYVAAKAGIAAMTLSLARELAPLGVAVNAVSPRATTRFTEGVKGATEAPAEAVAALVAYLASDAASDVSGQVLVAYGGRVARMRGWAVARKVDRSRVPETGEFGEIFEDLFPEEGDRGPEGLDLT